MKYLQSSQKTCMGFLLKLLNSQKSYICTSATEIIVKNTRLLKRTLPEDLDMIEFIQILNENGFDTIAFKRTLIIYTQTPIINVLMDRLLDTIEIQQERIKNSISKVSEILKYAIENNKILKQMIYSEGYSQEFGIKP